MKRINRNSKFLWLTVSILIAIILLVIYLLLEYRNYTLNDKLPFLYPIIIVTVLAVGYSNYNFYNKGLKHSLSFGMTRKELYRNSLKNIICGSLVISFFVFYDIILMCFVFNYNIVSNDIFFSILIFLILSFSGVLGIFLGVSTKNKLILIIYVFLGVSLYFIKPLLFEYSLYIMISFLVLNIIIYVLGYKKLLTKIIN